MNRLFLVFLTFSFPASSTFAAESSVQDARYNTYKPRAYKATPISGPRPEHVWTGSYIGGHFGWGSVRDVASTQVGGGLLAAGSVSSLTSDQIIGGVQMGYNFELTPSVLLGFEGEFTSLSRGTALTLTTNAPPMVLTYSANPDWVATAAMRFGYPANAALIYLKAGAAWLDTNYASFTTPASGVPFNDSSIRSGYVLGGGIEYAISRPWAVKAEYAFLNFENKGYNGTEVVTNMKQFKIGLNYRFETIGSFLGGSNSRRF